MDFNEIVEKVKANKKILIPAAAIGGVAGIYVLSKSGGLMGGGGGGNPPGTDAGQEPGQDTGAGFAQAIQALQDQLAKLQGDYQGGLDDVLSQQAEQGKGFSAALQGVVDQFNSALAQQQAQINDQLAGLSGGSTGLDQLGGLIAGLGSLQYSPYAPNTPMPTPGLNDALSKVTEQARSRLGNRTPVNTPNVGKKAAQGFNSLQAALGVRNNVPRSGYASAIRNALSNSTRKLTSAYTGTRRGGGSSFNSGRDPLRGLGVLRGAFTPKPSVTARKATGGGGSAFLKR